jgi:hypothetical protein
MAVVSRSRLLSPARLLIIVIALGLIFGLYRLILHQSVARQVQLLARSIPGCTGIRYGRLKIPFFSFQAHLQNVKLDFTNGIAPIAIGAIHLGHFRPGDRLPRILDVALDGVVAPSGHPLVPFGPRLQELGYSMVRGDLHIQWTRRGTALDAWDLDLAFKMAEAGEMALGLNLAKVNLEGIFLALQKPANWLMVLPPVELMVFRGSYRDRGLFERAVRVAAHDRGQTPHALRGAMQYQLQVLRQNEKDPHVQSVWQALEAFVRHPGRIRLRTNLTDPTPLGQLWWLRRPREVIQRLGLECRVG